MNAWRRGDFVAVSVADYAQVNDHVLYRDPVGFGGCRALRAGTATLWPLMGLVYSYLIAWVAGGVLLAGGLLLGRATSAPTRAPEPADERDPAQPAAAAIEQGMAEEKPLPALAPLPVRRPRFSLLAMGLVAYGGVGLLAEALGMPHGAFRPLSAAAAGLGIIAVSLVLLRRQTA